MMRMLLLVWSMFNTLAEPPEKSELTRISTALAELPSKMPPSTSTRTGKSLIVIIVVFDLNQEQRPARAVVEMCFTPLVREWWHDHLYSISRRKMAGGIPIAQRLAQPREGLQQKTPPLLDGRTGSASLRDLGSSRGLAPANFRGSFGLLIIPFIKDCVLIRFRGRMIPLPPQRKLKPKCRGEWQLFCV